jgi:hypothetical protein
MFTLRLIGRDYDESFVFPVKSVKEEVIYRLKTVPLTREQIANGATGTQVISQRYLLIVHADGEKEKVSMHGEETYAVETL